MKPIWDKLAREIGVRDQAVAKPDLARDIEAERGWRDWRWWANRSYRMACFGAGMILLEVYLLKLDHATALSALPFALLNLVAAIHSVKFPVFGQVSFHFILTYANLLLFGPAVAALGSGLGAFGQHLMVRRASLSSSMFQMGRSILAVAGAARIFAALGGRWGWPNLGWAMVVSSTATYLAVEFLLEAVPALWLRKMSLEPLGQALLRRAMIYAIFVPASVSIFYIYFPYGADGVLLFLIPVAAFALALELYARSATVSRNLSAIQDISRRISTILDPDRLTGEALEFIREIVPYQWGTIWLKDPRSGRLEARHSVGPPGETKPLPSRPPKVVVDAIQSDRTRENIEARANEDADFQESAPRATLAIPLSSRGEVLGALNLIAAAPRGFSVQQRRLLETLAANMAIAVENAIIYQRREREAIRDGLTRLYNHRYFQEKLAQEEERSRRSGRFCSLIILDIDHFKVYNDSFGHPAGDKLLIKLSRILESSVRQIDLVSRYGGEEFAVVLPECDKRNALVVAERIRKNVEAFPNPHPERYKLTISAGVSCFPADGDSREEILSKADQALYRAKTEGRNRVCA